MFNKFTALFIATMFLALTACSDEASDLPQSKPIKSANQSNIKNSAEVELPQYKITEDTVQHNIKRSVEVELYSRTDEETLHALAKQIHALSNVNVKRTFIGYRISGSGQNQVYWATTHYDPNLEVKILGETASDYEKLKNTDLPEGEVLGVWMVNSGFEYKMTAYKKDGQTHMHRIFADGSSTDDIYELIQLEKGVKLQNERDKEHGEYFIINEKGELEFWNNEKSIGNYYTAPTH